MWYQGELSEILVKTAIPEKEETEKKTKRADKKSGLKNKNQVKIRCRREVELSYLWNTGYI
jgi:hypothetical protein